VCGFRLRVLLGCGRPGAQCGRLWRSSDVRLCRATPCLSFATSSRKLSFAHAHSRGGSHDWPCLGIHFARCAYLPVRLDCRAPRPFHYALVLVGRHLRPNRPPCRRSASAGQRTRKPSARVGAWWTVAPEARASLSRAQRGRQPHYRGVRHAVGAGDIRHALTRPRAPLVPSEFSWGRSAKFALWGV